MLADQLKAKGWTPTAAGFTKGDWSVEFDTSSWLIVSTGGNPRVFDVPAPGEHEAAWTANLIEHLCQMEEERFRLRAALVDIRDQPQRAAETATMALEQCYHRWLGEVQNFKKQYCIHCGANRTLP